MADGILFVDGVEFGGDPSINDSPTVEGLERARADMFANEYDAFCGFTATSDDGPLLS